MSPIKECIKKKKANISPIWIMRQAGRYLPEFRKIRKKNPDFVKYAEAYGAHGHRISSVTGFVETIDRAYREGGVHVVDLPVDYSQNVKELITDLRDHKPIV